MTTAIPKSFKLCVRALTHGSCPEECREGHIVSEHLVEVRAQFEAKQTAELCRFCCVGKCHIPAEKCPRLHVPLDWFLVAQSQPVKKETRVYESPPRRREQRSAAHRDGSLAVDTRYRPPQLNSSRLRSKEKHLARESSQPRNSRQQPEVLQALSWIRGKVSEAHKVNELWKELAQRTGVDYTSTLAQGAQIEKDIYEHVMQLSQYLDQCLRTLGQTPSTSPRDDSDSDSDGTSVINRCAIDNAHGVFTGYRRTSSEQNHQAYEGF